MVSKTVEPSLDFEGMTSGTVTLRPKPQACLQLKDHLHLELSLCGQLPGGEDPQRSEFTIAFKAFWPKNFPAHINQVVCDRESITLLVFESRGSALRQSVLTSEAPNRAGVSCTPSSFLSLTITDFKATAGAIPPSDISMRTGGARKES